MLNPTDSSDDTMIVKVEGKKSESVYICYLRIIMQVKGMEI